MQQHTDNLAKVEVPRFVQITLAIVALAWAAAATTIAAQASQGIARRFQLGALASLLESIFLLFLAVVGFRALDWIATRGRFRSETLQLPRRAGYATEWATGSAIGWGLCVAAVLPVAISGHLHGRLSWNPGATAAILTALVTLLVAALAEEVVFRGYPFLRLSAALGPAWAALILSLTFAFLMVRANPPHNALLAIVDCTLFGIVLAIAWMRTHALWLGWGLHFAYRAVAAIALGLPIAGRGEFGSPADLYTSGPRWLTGGAFGLDSALLTALVMLGGVIVLYRATRDYAWKYTYTPIVAAGYEVTIAPPAAHVEMEKSAAPPPLVQILTTTSQTRSVETQPTFIASSEQ